MPLIQLLQDSNRTELTIPNQKHGCVARDQAAHIEQQGQLFMSRAMSLDIFDPRPCNWNGSFAVGNANDQLLVTKTDLGAIYNQADLT